MAGSLSVSERFSKSFALGLQENEVMVEMLAVILDISAHGDDAHAVMDSLTCERIVWQSPEYSRPLSSANVEERQGILE